MIVFPQGLILTESEAGRPLTHARIGYQTWTRDLESSAASASTQAADAPPDAVLRPDTYEYWEPTALPATITIDFGQQRDVDYVGVLGMLGGFSVLAETSDGNLVGSPSELLWENVSNEVMPVDDAPLMFLDDSRSARYLRLTVDGGDGEMPRIAVVYAGEVLAMQRAVYGGHSPMNLARETELHQSLSKGGQFLGQSFRRHGQVGSAAFRHLTPSWYRDNLDPFVKAARQYPFFFAWRPETYPLEVAYAWIQKDIRPSNMGLASYMQVSFDMVGWGYE